LKRQPEVEELLGDSVRAARHEHGIPIAVAPGRGPE
jgi:hypothetical protein